MVHVVPDMKVITITWKGTKTVLHLVVFWEDKVSSIKYIASTSFGSFLGGRGGCSVACSSNPQSSHIGCSSWLWNSEVGQKMFFLALEILKYIRKCSSGIQTNAGFYGWSFVEVVHHRRTEYQTLLRMFKLFEVTSHQDNTYVSLIKLALKRKRREQWTLFAERAFQHRKLVWLGFRIIRQVPIKSV